MNAICNGAIARLQSPFFGSIGGFATRANEPTGGGHARPTWAFAAGGRWAARPKRFGEFLDFRSFRGPGF